MEAQLPDPSPSLTELRAVGGALLARLAELRERDVAVPDELWRAARRFEPLLDGVDPEREEADDLWELALSLPGLLARAEPPAAEDVPRAGDAPEGADCGRETASADVPRPAGLPLVAVPAPRLFVGDGVEHVEARGT
ncbi:hypothetical protein [Streptacidiphilus pinicola]|nr:hypothetical protein [Streptacidiphilus pinicola]